MCSLENSQRPWLSKGEVSDGLREPCVSEKDNKEKAYFFVAVKSIPMPLRGQCREVVRSKTVKADLGGECLA